MSVNLIFVSPRPNEKCSICFEALVEDVVEHGDKGSSLHPVHEKCMKTWLSVQESCPICRIGINVSWQDRVIQTIDSFNPGMPNLGFIIGAAFILEGPVRMLGMKPLSLVCTGLIGGCLGHTVLAQEGWKPFVERVWALWPFGYVVAGRLAFAEF